MPEFDPAEARRQRGLAIAAICKITKKHDQWIVPSQTGNGSYRVNLNPPSPLVPMCTCPDFEARSEPCKHVYAVRYVIEREKNDDGSETVTETLTVTKRTCAPRKTYRQNWPAYNAAQTHEKEQFQSLLHDLCEGIAEPAPNDKGGRPPVRLSDRVFSAVFKVFSTVSGRRFTCDLCDARDKGYLSQAPHYNSIFRYVEDPSMTQILRRLIVESALPLRSVEVDFAVDSSGFATSRFVRWFDHKYGKPMQEYDWVKVSIITGVKTNVVTAAVVDEKKGGDCPQFAPLVKETARHFTLREVSADKAYASYDNMDLVAQHNATPFIAFPANTTGRQGGTFAKMFHYFNFKRDEFLSHYHKRSNVEATFSMIKAKFGDGIRSKTDVAMVNESLCKILRITCAA